jgi:hypothetical protein
MSFDKPANPDVEYFAAVNAIVVVCHRRFS